MKITIHRGTNQIGGCVTEYEYKGWKMFVDYGEQLPGAPTSSEPLTVEGLTHGDVSKSALLITHYHRDHIGKIAELPADLPIYMGKISKEIASELSNHLSTVSREHQKMAERLKTVLTFTPGEQFSFGEFKIMPIVIDHSAFDAYAYCIEAGGLKTFHTGDFRTHGFRSRKLPQVIEKFIGKVDYMVCEATNVSRPDATTQSERELQVQFIDSFRENKFNVVYVSSTNIDRLFGLYRAAVRTGRIFLIDPYQKRMMDVVVGRDSIWGKSKLYKYVKGREPMELKYQPDSDFLATDSFKDFLNEHGYVIIARANPRFDKLLSQIPDANRKVYLSQWKGYLDSNNVAHNAALAKSIGVDYKYFHTSGHCNMDSLENLIQQLNPKAIIPIHTDNPKAFADLFCDKWPVMLLGDGESFSAIKDSGFDTTIAKIIALKPLETRIEIVENNTNELCYSLDEKSLGEFKRRNDAINALRHVAYAPKRKIAYSIEADEDMSPSFYVVYDSDFNELAVYEEGGHAPDEAGYQQPTGYKPGEKVLAAIGYPFNVLIPCEFDGPITEEYVQNCYENDELKISDSYEDYIAYFLDWDWDKVLVRPLLRLKSNNNVLPELEEVQRIYVFPYRLIE